MKKFSSLVVVGFLSIVPSITWAGGLLEGGPNSNITTNPLANGIRSIVNFSNQVLIPAILAIAFLVFVWGMVKFFVIGGADEKARSDGKNLMMYALAGFVVVLIFFGIVNLVANGIGLRGQDIQAPRGNITY